VAQAGGDETLSDARARAVAGYWYDERNPASPLSLLARDGRITATAAEALAADVRSLEAAAGGQPSVAQLQLRQLLVYVQTNGPRGPVPEWTDLQEVHTPVPASRSPYPGREAGLRTAPPAARHDVDPRAREPFDPSPPSPPREPFDPRPAREPFSTRREALADTLRHRRRSDEDWFPAAPPVPAPVPAPPAAPPPPRVPDPPVHEGGGSALDLDLDLPPPPWERRR